MAAPPPYPGQPAAGYPQGQPAYPQQGGYPPQAGYPAAQPGYPPAQQGYPQPAAQPGYPPAQGYPPQGQTAYPPGQTKPQVAYPVAQPQTAYPQQGYVAAQPAQTVIVQQTTYTHGTGYYRTMIPIMPMWLAIICLILNICGSGLGTIVASFSVFCCASFQQQGQEACGVFVINFFVGILQMILLWVFIIGWIWAVIWGILFVSLSTQYYNVAPATQTRTVTATTY